MAAYCLHRVYHGIKSTNLATIRLLFSTFHVTGAVDPSTKALVHIELEEHFYYKIYKDRTKEILERRSAGYRKWLLRSFKVTRGPRDALTFIRSMFKSSP